VCHCRQPTKGDEQFGLVLVLLGKNSKGISELQSLMSEMRALCPDINVWKPQVDNRVDELENVARDVSEWVEVKRSAVGTWKDQEGEGGLGFPKNSHNN
jgi:LmbE family N-acetylglucosaminyl deacetylase